MWIYEKKLEFPVRIKTCNPKMAKYIISQYGGPDGINLQYKFSCFLDIGKERIIPGNGIIQALPLNFLLFP